MSGQTANLFGRTNDAPRRGNHIRRLDWQARYAACRLRQMRPQRSLCVDTHPPDGRQQTGAQIAETRATLEARWNEFEHDLEGYLTTINSEVSLRKAVFQARVKAEELYWQQTIAEMKTSVATVAAEQRAVIEARIAQVQADADAAKRDLPSFNRLEVKRGRRCGMVSPMRAWPSTKPKKRYGQRSNGPGNNPNAPRWHELIVRERPGPIDTR